MPKRVSYAYVEQMDELAAEAMKTIEQFGPQWQSDRRQWGFAMHNMARVARQLPDARPKSPERALLLALAKPAIAEVLALATSNHLDADALADVRTFERRGDSIGDDTLRRIERWTQRELDALSATPEPTPAAVKRRGRKTATESAMCREAAFATLDTHPTLENDSAGLARELGGQASETQCRRYIGLWRKKRQADALRQSEAAKQLAKMRDAKE
jgi:hypothetical protein